MFELFTEWLSEGQMKVNQFLFLGFLSNLDNFKHFGFDWYRILFRQEITEDRN